jgi:hypothetical protein
VPQIKKVKNETPEQKRLRELQEERNKGKKFEYKPGSSTPEKPVKAKKKKKPKAKQVRAGQLRSKDVKQAYKDIEEGKYD